MKHSKPLPTSVEQLKNASWLRRLWRSLFNRSRTDHDQPSPKADKKIYGELAVGMYQRVVSGHDGDAE